MVLTVLHDKTAGWDKTSDAISISQIQAETSLKRSNIQRALLELQIEDGPVEVISRGVREPPVPLPPPHARPRAGPVPRAGRVHPGLPAPPVNNVPAGG